MRCAIWYHLLNSKNVENYRGGVLLWVKLPEVSVFHVCFKNCTKAWNFFLSNSLHWCFPRFLNSTNGTKSRRIPHKISLSILMHCKKKTTIRTLFLSCRVSLWEPRNMKSYRSHRPEMICEKLYLVSESV